MMVSRLHVPEKFCTDLDAQSIIVECRVRTAEIPGTLQQTDSASRLLRTLRHGCVSRLAPRIMKLIISLHSASRHVHKLAIHSRVFPWQCQ